MSYFNNHNHTEYSNALLSFPDVIARLPNLIQYAYDLGLSGLTITEHEGISSHIKALDYYENMQKDRPFTLALGNEIYLMEESEDLENRENHNTYPYYHFILKALDTEGHKQLRMLSTRAWLRAWRQGKMFRRPTYYSDLEEIVKSNQGHIIASSACLGSRIDKLLMNDNDEKAIAEIKRLNNIFGKGNFYLECQPVKSNPNVDIENILDEDLKGEKIQCQKQSKVNRKLRDIVKKYPIKLIPTTDTHYLKKEDIIIHRTYLKSQEGDREPGHFYDSTYMMSADELREHLSFDFTDEQIDQMYEWSNEICNRVKGYDILHNPIIPQIPIDKLPKNFKAKGIFKQYYQKYPNFGYYAQDDRPLHERYFFYQIEQGLIDKIVNRGKNVEQYIARLEEEWTELHIISDQLDTSMPSYYSTMSKIIELIWKANSLAMPARGSAAGFLTCYLLEVTQIDPVPLGDYFPSWRHLN